MLLALASPSPARGAFSSAARWNVLGPDLRAAVAPCTPGGSGALAAFAQRFRHIWSVWSLRREVASERAAGPSSSRPDRPPRKPGGSATAPRGSLSRPPVPSPGSRSAPWREASAASPRESRSARPGSGGKPCLPRPPHLPEAPRPGFPAPLRAGGGKPRPQRLQGAWPPQAPPTSRALPPGQPAQHNKMAVAPPGA